MARNEMISGEMRARTGRARRLEMWRHSVGLSAKFGWKNWRVNSLEAGTQQPKLFEGTEMVLWPFAAEPFCDLRCGSEPVNPMSGKGPRGRKITG